MKSPEGFGYVTPRDYNAYVKFNILKGKYYRVKVTVLIALIAAVCVFMLVWGFLTGEKSYWITAGIIALCSFIFIYTINVNVKNTCNKSAKVIRAKQRVRFGKNGFIFELLFNNSEEDEYNEIFYDEIDMIYLAPKAIYIYIEKRSVIVIPKRNLNISPLETRDFLIKFVPSQKLTVCV